MSEDMSITSLLNDEASTAASFIRTSAKISTEQTKLSAAFSSGSGNAVQTLSNSQIVNELRMDGLSSTKTAQQIASDYNISLVRAQQILDELNNSNEYSSYSVNSGLTNSYSYSVEYNTADEYSTVAYTV